MSGVWLDETQPPHDEARLWRYAIVRDTQGMALGFVQRSMLDERYIGVTYDGDELRMSFDRTHGGKTFVTRAQAARWVQLQSRRHVYRVRRAIPQMLTVAGASTSRTVYAVHHPDSDTAWQLCLTHEHAMQLATRLARTREDDDA